MFRKSIVAKLWLTIVLLMVLVIASLGLGLFGLMEDFYYSQLTKNLVTQGLQLADMYSQEPQELQDWDQLSRLSRIINAHIMVLDKQSQIIVCNMDLHLLPGTVFAEDDLNTIFKGDIIAHRGYHYQFATQMLTVGIPIKTGQQINQALLIYMPVAPITATLTSLRGLVLWALLGALILASVLAFFLSRSLSKPLVKMNQAALALARGNYNERITIRSSDEIGALGASLNYLTEQLRDNITKVQKLEEMRRELIANVSHELRTPISLITGYSEAILDGMVEKPEQRLEFVRVIQTEADRLKRLVEDLLELSRLQSGSVALEKEWVDIGQIAQGVREKFSQILSEEHIDFQVEISPGAEVAWADRFRLEQILINLVGNAIRYTPRGQITLSTAKYEKNTIIRISDTGIGIPAADLPFIFERFYRADKSRNRQSGGTGLGLAIVNNLVEAHQGSITVDSQEGQGTVFTISLPA